MASNRKLRHRIFGTTGLLIALLAFGPGASSSPAAGPPAIEEVWSLSTFSATARIRAKINPNGLATTYHIDYITEDDYEANVDDEIDPFTGTSRIPVGDAAIGSGTSAVTSQLIISFLPADTAYRYRIVAQNSGGTTISDTYPFATQIVGGGSILPDARGWEMVSPVDKNGGQVDAPESLAGGGVLQAAADGQSVTYGSAASFGEGTQGAAVASQYVSSRSEDGWSTRNVTAPLYSGSYGTDDEGVPYQLFSEDLASALLLNGRRCRGEAIGCAVPNPPLPGTGAPVGYQNFYLRDNGSDSYEALLGSSFSGILTMQPAHFELTLAGASIDFSQVVLSTCAALTPDATEVPLGEGCDPEAQNLYLWAGGDLTLVNLLPSDSQGTPGAELGAQSGAVSSDGSRVYWRSLDTGDLYVRSGGQTRPVDNAAGGGGSFEAASEDGSLAYYSESGHLYRYNATTHTGTDITPFGGVEGVLGTSTDGTHVYYLTSSGLFMRRGAAVTEVADSADSSNYPASTGTARVSDDGSKLLFMATDSLTGYDNEDLGTEDPDSQVYLYDDEGETLRCVSCNPTHGRPIGASSIPGAIANGSGPLSTQIYKPRALSDDGDRVYFDSGDAIGLTDTNGQDDVYQWEANGTGECTRPEGCVALISSGRDTEDSSFVDASADGSDVFFITSRSLVSADLPGSADLYDAREGGGFPDPIPPLTCAGDACQPLPSAPTDPTLTTRLEGPGNPGVRYPKQRVHCKGGFVKRKGKCVKLKRKSKREAKSDRRNGR